jgi:hypothetical protein
MRPEPKESRRRSLAPLDQIIPSTSRHVAVPTITMHDADTASSLEALENLKRFVEDVYLSVKLS